MKKIVKVSMNVCADAQEPKGQSGRDMYEWYPTVVQPRYSRKLIFQQYIDPAHFCASSDVCNLAPV